MTNRNDPTPGTRKRVMARDNETCVAQTWSDCAGILTLQHRIGRGMGGSRVPAINRAGNLIVMCSHHNELIEKDANFRKIAVARGWSIPRNWTPAILAIDVPVRYWDGPHMIDDDGNRELVAEALAAELWAVFSKPWQVG